ncbi:hypothetical protein AVEN_154343-1 [Araneus ventricosus]|uniref:Glucose-methanol-choline oxidoreductase C-terminal domain-containing protein n=1 Tax=Araneus ventricosus TaxID=182803 RepID=A0A4Y2M5U8_ARAVE|nr:hypothetical protein AVEN_154343-1 [Araneus ventricosus]
MQKVGAKPFETLFPGCEQFFGNEDLYFTCLARGAVITLSHQVGTAKMGDPRDPTTVVDPLLRKYMLGPGKPDADMKHDLSEMKQLSVENTWMKF